MSPKVAVIEAVPAVTGVASPYLLTVATLVSEEFHVTDGVRSFVVLSEYIPVAVNSSLAPTATLGFVGSSAMETSTAAGADQVLPLSPHPATMRSINTRIRFFQFFSMMILLL
jgi:hypothetical protein